MNSTLLHAAFLTAGSLIRIAQHLAEEFPAVQKMHTSLGMAVGAALGVAVGIAVGTCGT